MNHRLTIAAAVAVILASVSEITLIRGGSWLAETIGAVIVVALAGTLTRLAPNHAAIAATVLAAAVSVPLLTDRSNYLKLLAVLIIACCAASATRLRLLRPVADIVTYLSGLLLYLNLTMAGSRSFAFLIPTARSLRHLDALIGSASATIKYQPPVGPAAGVTLLAAGSIGLTAIIVDVVAVRLRKPAIAGLPLLVLYMAPIATAAKPSAVSNVLTFLIAATGYLGLLASDGRSRLRGWGRVVTVWHYAGEDERLGGADIRGLAATGRRIGLAAVCAAIVAPLLLPTLNLHRLFGGSSGDHSVTAGLPLPLDEMRGLLTSPVNEPVLSYQTSSKSGEYLQVYVLNYFPSDGAWNLIPPGNSITVGATALNQPPGLSAATAVTQVSTVIKLDHVGPSTSAGYNFPVFFLPLPYWPTLLNASGSWSESRGTLMVYSGSANHSGLRYVVTSGQVVPTKAEEVSTTPPPKSIREQFGIFRSPLNAQLTAIARRITKGARTPFAKAVAIERYFQAPGNFVYTLQAIDYQNSARGLLDFLTKDRRGFCEQFAFAMAVLARLEGIPSRIAIGYTSGTPEGHDRWQVTTADAHAWPELYFSGLGWLRFEPTPGGPKGQGTATQPGYATQIPPILPPGGGSSSTTKNQKIDADLPGQQGTGTHVRNPASDPLPAPLPPVAKPGAPIPVGPILLGVLALLVLLAAMPAAAHGLSRRRRWRAATDTTALADAAWEEICADLDDFGFSRRLSESPRALARRISADAEIDESARQALARIALVVERTRYALEPAAADGIRSDVTQVRRALARSVGRLQRVRAILFPASTLRPLGHSAGRSFGQLTGWVLAPTEA
jgi:transglutaminase-like putative cysteine protease